MPGRGIRRPGRGIQHAVEKGKTDELGLAVSKTRVDKVQLLIGLLSLLAGALVYLISRPVGSAYFLLRLRTVHIFFNRLPDILGHLGFYAPGFLHTLAFSLISAAILWAKKAKMAVCSVWLGIDLFFEVAQKFGHQIANYLPKRFAELPGIREIIGFLVFGTFDVYDLIAISIGGLLAIIIVQQGTSLGAKKCVRTISIR